MARLRPRLAVLWSIATRDPAAGGVACRWGDSACGEADRAAHAGAAQAAVTAGVLGEVLLVVVLGVVERPCRIGLRRFRW